jgi:glutathione synthase/RimK-type ligase-like ATP-grasp enzyme
MGGFATKRNVSKSLLANQELSQNVPETRFYSNSTLKRMLNKYKMVYVKPNMGTGGKGVIRVEKLGQCYKYQIQTTTRLFSSFDKMANSIGLRTKSCPYVIQRGIHLLRYNSRRFDLRIMVQKNPKGKWETTGVIGRLGHPKKIVTNVCRGGSSKPVETLLKNHVANVTKYIKRLKSLGYRAARQLNKTFPRIKELGCDVGIDRNLHPWILEANPRPAIYGFKSLKDKSIYRKMCRYQKSYRRR